MGRFFVDQREDYCLCLDTTTLKWIVGTKELVSECRDNNEELIDIFENKEDVAQELDNSEPDKITGMSVLPSLRCNLRCVHCFYSSSPDGDYSSIGKTDIPLIVEFARENQVGGITIGGGEPLAWPHIRLLLVELLEKTDAKIFVLTNGLLLQDIDDILDEFRTRFNVQVSMDAATEETYKKIRGGDFRVLLKNIGRLQEIGVESALSYTIHSRNKDEVLPFVKMAEGIGVKSLHFPILESYGRAKFNNIAPLAQELVRLYQFLLYYALHEGALKVFFVEEIKLRLRRRLIRYNCSAFNGQVSIGPDGHFYPCSELIGSQYRMGHLREFKDLRRRLREIRANTGIGSPIVEHICPDCPVKLLCGGGCRAVELLSGKQYLEARAGRMSCEILINSALTVLWELANSGLNPPISLSSLYDPEVLRMGDNYAKTR